MERIELREGLLRGLTLYLVGLFISQKSSSSIGFLSRTNAKTGFTKKSHDATLEFLMISFKKGKNYKHHLNINSFGILGDLPAEQVVIAELESLVFVGHFPGPGGRLDR